MSLSQTVEKSLSHQAPKPDTDQVARIERLRGAAKFFAEAIEECVGSPDLVALAKGEHKRMPTRERATAITNLEQSLMWAVKGIVLE